MSFTTRRVLPERRLALCLVALLPACTESSKTTHLRLAHGLDTKHPVHQALEVFAREVEERSLGGIRISVYPSEQLGSERELVELLQLGSVAMTKISASVLENFDSRFSVFGLPYLFESRAHAFQVLDGPIGANLLEGLTDARLRGLGFFDAGSRSFYVCDRSVQHPDDLATLKIRTQESQSAMAMVRVLGASPTPIAWGELYTALAQGVVDGAENNPPSFYSSRHFEVCPFYSLDEHTAVPDVVLISDAIWQGLSDSERGILEESMDAAVAVQRQLWSAASQDAIERLRAAGVTITRPEPVPFRSATSELALRVGPEVGALIAQIGSTAGSSEPVAARQSQDQGEPP